MRLWHKDLIPYLPRQQLLGQWRECCCIVRNIAMLGTPNHILVNKVMDIQWVIFGIMDCALWKKWKIVDTSVTLINLKGGSIIHTLFLRQQTMAYLKIGIIVDI